MDTNVKTNKIRAKILGDKPHEPYSEKFATLKDAAAALLEIKSDIKQLHISLYHNTNPDELPFLKARLAILQAKESELSKLINMCGELSQAQVEKAFRANNPIIQIITSEMDADGHIPHEIMLHAYLDAVPYLENYDRSTSVAIAIRDYHSNTRTNYYNRDKIENKTQKFSTLHPEYKKSVESLANGEVYTGYVFPEYKDGFVYNGTEEQQKLRKLSERILYAACDKRFQVFNELLHTTNVSQLQGMKKEPNSFISSVAAVVIN